MLQYYNLGIIYAIWEISYPSMVKIRFSPNPLFWGHPQYYPPQYPSLNASVLPRFLKSHFWSRSAWRIFLTMFKNRIVWTHNQKNPFFGLRRLASRNCPNSLSAGSFLAPRLGPPKTDFFSTPQTSLQAASWKPKKRSRYLQNCGTKIHMKDSILSSRWRFLLKRRDSFADPRRC